jgi:hypothetical protein
MSDTTTSDEPITGPIDPIPPPPPPPPATRAYAVADVPEHSHPTSRLNKVLAWVGIIAGSVLIVAVIFGTGFRIGLHVGSSHGGGMGHHRHHGNGQMEERGGPPQFPGGGGGMWRPGGPGFMFPPPGFFPGFPGGPGGQGNGPGGSGGQGPGQPPTTVVPAPPGR